MSGWDSPQVGKRNSRALQTPSSPVQNVVGSYDRDADIDVIYDSASQSSDNNDQRFAFENFPQSPQSPSRRARDRENRLFDQTANQTPVRSATDSYVGDSYSEAKREIPVNVASLLKGQSFIGHGQMEDHHQKQVTTPYMRGQLVHAYKIGVWVAFFGASVTAMFKGNLILVCLARLASNLAVLIFSPCAGNIVSRVSIQKILVASTLFRGFLYVAVLPTAWAFFMTEYGVAQSPGYFIAFLLVMFLDGVAIAFGNVLDADCGGLQMVGSFFGFSPSPAAHYKLSFTFEMTLHAGMVVWTHVIDHI
jgi:hypothetical protein